MESGWRALSLHVGSRRNLCTGNNFPAGCKLDSAGCGIQTDVWGLLMMAVCTSFAREALPLIRRQGELIAEKESIEQELDDLTGQIDALELRDAEKAWIKMELDGEDGVKW